MDKKALAENFDKLAFNNRALIKDKIRGILLYFRGHGYRLNPPVDSAGYEMCAENGILFLFPQYNPCCWMNKKTVRYIDAIIDAAIEENGLAPDIPVGIYGGSMGGYNTFHYSMKSKHRIVAACANCPCVNMEYEVFVNNLGLITTYFDSAMDDTDDFRTYVYENSPLNMVEKLPKIPYRIIVGHKDTTLYPEMHSVPMIKRMAAAGHNVERVDFPNMGHCNFTKNDLVDQQKWVVEKILQV